MPQEPDFFVKAPYSLIACRTLSATARLAYLILKKNSRDGRTVEMTEPQLAEELSVSTATASNALKELIAAGLVDRTVRGLGQPSLHVLRDIPLRGAKATSTETPKSTSVNSRNYHPSTQNYHSGPQLPDSHTLLPPPDRSLDHLSPEGIDHHPHTPSNTDSQQSRGADGGGTGGGAPAPQPARTRTNARPGRMNNPTPAVISDRVKADAELIVHMLKDMDPRIAEQLAMTAEFNGQPQDYIRDLLGYVYHNPRIDNPAGCFRRMVERNERRVWYGPISEDEDVDMYDDDVVVAPVPADVPRTNIPVSEAQIAQSAFPADHSPAQDTVGNSDTHPTAPMIAPEPTHVLGDIATEQTGMTTLADGDITDSPDTHPSTIVAPEPHANSSINNIVPDPIPAIAPNRATAGLDTAGDSTDPPDQEEPIAAPGLLASGNTLDPVGDPEPRATLGGAVPSAAGASSVSAAPGSAHEQITPATSAVDESARRDDLAAVVLATHEAQQPVVNSPLCEPEILQALNASAWRFGIEVTEELQEWIQVVWEGSGMTSSRFAEVMRQTAKDVILRKAQSVTYTNPYDIWLEHVVRRISNFVKQDSSQADAAEQSEPQRED